MDNSKPIFAVYAPPSKGLPFLAVILNSDGSTTSHRFDTEDEAEAFNRHMAKSLYDGNTKH